MHKYTYEGLDNQGTSTASFKRKSDQFPKIRFLSDKEWYESKDYLVLKEIGARANVVKKRLKRERK